MTQPVSLWVAPVSNIAGVARQFLDVARSGLPGWKTTFACPPGPLFDHLVELGHAPHALDLDQQLPLVVRQLHGIIKAASPDVVHSHLAKADFLCAMAAPGTGTRLVSTEHHIPEDPLIFHGTRFKASSRQLAHRVRLTRFTALIAVSESTKRDMIRFWKPRQPITVVLNGVDRPAVAEQRAPGMRLLSLTRLSPEKNLETTLRVFARVLATHPEAHLTLGGSGDAEGQLRSLAKELGLGSRVDFAGFIDAPAAMASHDVLLQPSKADNLSYTLLDATAAGMGVVASTVGGNSEIVAARCLFAPDDVQGMSEAVVEQGLVIGRRPHLQPAIPTVEEMTEQIVAVYEAALGSAHSVRPRPATIERASR